MRICPVVLNCPYFLIPARNMMESIFAYSLRSSLVLALLYIPYMLMLRQESFFRLNRMVLLFILLLSLALPVLDIHSLAWEGLAPMQNVFRPASSEDEASVHAILLPEVAVHAGYGTSSAFGAWHYVSMLSVLIMSAVFLWHVYQVLRMDVVMRRGSLWQQTLGGVHIYCHADEVSPYSWMRSVVISERDYHENGREILLHEMAHIRARHSLDLLLLALVQTLQWWNPLVYILGGSMRDVHEYEADDSVLRHGVSARDYQLLLIKKVVGSSSYAFANNFDHSLIIKRITMMQKSKSAKWMCSKVLYILPMATLALSAFATVQPTMSPASVAGSDHVADNEGKVITLTANRQGKGREKAFGAMQSADNVAMNLAGVGSRTGRFDADSTAGTTWAKVNFCSAPAHLPVYPGGELAMYEYLGKTVKYPAEAMAAGVQGKVNVQFFVKDDGSVGTIGLIRPVRFDSYTPEGDTPLADVVVTAYVDKCRAQGKNLSAEEEAAYRAGVEAIINEAVRVVAMMPKWTPGYTDKEKTKPCNTRYVLPIMFRLQ